MENKEFIVKKGSFEYNGKTCMSYRVEGTLMGKLIYANLVPPDLGGWAIMEILFSETEVGKLIIKPYEVRDQKTGKVTATGNSYAVQVTDKDGEVYEFPVKPAKATDKAAMNLILR